MRIPHRPRHGLATIASASCQDAEIIMETNRVAEIINLRSARKARARGEKENAAAANRRQFGQTKEEKAAARRERAHLDQVLDGAKRDTD